MQACANYKIVVFGTSEDILAATNILAEAFDDDTIMGQKIIRIEGTRKVVWLEHATNIAKEIVRKVPKLKKMVIYGFTDSESDGTMMDFLIKFDGGLLTSQSTKWYGVFEPLDIDYEEFCEEYIAEDGNPLYSEEEFKKFISGDEQYFVVEDEYGAPKIVKTVALDEPFEIDPNSEDTVPNCFDDVDWDEDDDWDEEE